MNWKEPTSDGFVPVSRSTKGDSLSNLLINLKQHYSFSKFSTNYYYSSKLEILLENGEDCGTLSAPKIDLLLASSKSSSFGKGTETIYDESVRKGNEITADQLIITVKSSYCRDKKIECFLKNRILEEMKTNPRLETVLSNGFQLKLYKLAIYQPGGHFQTHRDTVHAADHKMTLLVEVNSEHSGGDLILSRNGKEIRWRMGCGKPVLNGMEILPSFDLPSPPAVQTTTQPTYNYDMYIQTKPTCDCDKYGSYLKWIMFYTDIEHRVEPVLSGTRMVLQFDVMIPHPSSSNKRKLEEEEEEYASSDFHKAERDIFQSYQISEINQSSLININENLISQVPVCVKEILTLGRMGYGVAFPCTYLYTVQTIEPEHLKDVDRSIFDSFLQSTEGFIIGLAPILLRTFTCDGYFGRYTTAFKVLAPFKVYGRSIDGTTFASICYDIPKRTIDYYHTGSELVEMVDNIPHIGHTGNDAQEGMNEYRSVAFVVFENDTEAIELDGK